MKKYLQMALLISVIFIAFLSGNDSSTAFAANTDVRAVKDGKVVYYKSLSSLLYEELNEGTTFTKKVQDYNTNKWVSLESVTIVKVSASKYIYFAKAADATKYIQAYKAKNNVTLKKVTLNSIKAQTQAKYTKQAPTIQLKASTTAPTNKDVTVTVTITDNGKVAVKKWSKGAKKASDFKAKDKKITGNTFTVSDNGTYTVYAIDNEGNKKVKSIKISNIDKSIPTVSLNPNTTEVTNADVTITIAVNENVKVATQKWATGNQTATYFTKNGQSFKGDTFTVNANGTYTVYVKDSAGNEQVQTVTISNIDKVAPALTVSVPTADVTAVSKKIQIAATDDNGIQKKKWAYGDKEVSYFADKGSSIAPLQNANQKDKIIVLKNGVYTVYIEDKAGNKTVEKVTIDGISEFTEVTQAGVQCEVCRMDLFNTDPNKVYSAKATDHEGYTHYFCRIGCMTHQEHANGTEFLTKYVRDYSATLPHLNNWIKAEEAVTVKFKADETAKGLMGWKLFHFKDLAGAASYLGTSENKVVTEKLADIKEYAKTNNKGMDYKYEVDKVVAP